MADGENTLRNMALEVLSLIVLYVVSILFYHTVEGWSYLDAAFFVTYTITTVGYGKPPETEIGKIYTIFLIFIGISLAFLLIASIAFYRRKTVDKHMANRISLLRSLSGLQEKPEEKKTREKILKKLMPPT